MQFGTNTYVAQTTDVGDSLILNIVPPAGLKFSLTLSTFTSLNDFSNYMTFALVPP